METIHKTRFGRVISNKMDKTVVVGVETIKRHRLYNKNVKRIVRYKAHDAGNRCALGDTVRIVETRPLSKEKHWRVAEIITKKEQIEVRPEEIAEEMIPSTGEAK
ncbi:MAG: 30S ribosomal protein S17 [Chloroflexi bacterium RBG_16_57_8]|nr:MAG: 30S ribosomal protein S17 [Chloroflexi bacterium RBG_16_57_8]